MTDVAAPRRGRVLKADRIIGIDIARGIALITMAATHMLPTHVDATTMTGVGWLFAGRASSLFALLAGVSLAIVTGGLTPRTGRDMRRSRATIAIRAGVIGLIGLLLAMTDTPVAVILAYYAVYFLLALPFLGLRPRALWALAIAWAVLSPVISHVVRQQLPDPPRGQVDLIMLFTEPVTALQALLFTGYYPAFTWLTYILAGLAVGRSDLRSLRTAIALAIGGTATAVGTWLLSTYLLAAGGVDALVPDRIEYRGVGAVELQQLNLYGVTPTEKPQWLLLAAPHSGTPFDLIGTTGSALAILGVCLLLARSAAIRTVLTPVAAAGAMTLTLYTLHVVTLALPVGEWGTWSYYAVHVAAFLILPTLWLRRAPKGPLEYAVHEISTTLGAKAVPRPTAPR